MGEIGIINVNSIFLMETLNLSLIHCGLLAVAVLLISVTIAESRPTIYQRFERVGSLILATKPVHKYVEQGYYKVNPHSRCSENSLRSNHNRL
jgi:hypothetical protein